MKTKTALLAVVWLVAIAASGTNAFRYHHGPGAHHHLALQNDFVKVFDVQVSPGDSIVLHRHDQDTVAIAIGEQLVTVGFRASRTSTRKMRTPRFGCSAAATCIPPASMGTCRTTPSPWNFCTRRPIFTMSAPKFSRANPDCRASFHQKLRAYTRPVAAGIGRDPGHARTSLPHQSVDLGNLSSSPVPAGDRGAGCGRDFLTLPQGTEKKLQPGDFEWIEGGASQGRISRTVVKKMLASSKLSFPARNKKIREGGRSQDEICQDCFSCCGHLRLADSLADLFHGKQGWAGNAARNYASGIFLWISGRGSGLAGACFWCCRRIPSDTAR